MLAYRLVAFGLEGFQPCWAGPTEATWRRGCWGGWSPARLAGRQALASQLHLQFPDMVASKLMSHPPLSSQPHAATPCYAFQTSV